MLKVILGSLIISISLFAQNSLGNLLQRAKGGDIEAIYQLGYIYENGIGVEANRAKSIAFYKKAAKLGSEDAKLSLELMDLDSDISQSKSIVNQVSIKGISHLETVISGKDFKEIVKKAKSGDSEALFIIAVMYENGVEPLKQDSKKAQMFYKKAAKAGNKKALEVLSLSKD